MDTSREYIKMCQEAKELRNNYEPLYPAYNERNRGEMWEVFDPVWQVGDYWVEIDSSEVHISTGEKFDKYDFHRWNLPRQDQLQEIAKFGNSYPSVVVRELELFLDMRTEFRPKTMEQAWLMHIMWYQFDKHWNPIKLLWEDKHDEIDEAE